MIAEVVQVADAVVVELNARTWSKPFVAVRAWIPRASAEDLADLRVTVAPMSRVETIASRADESHDYQIGVGVQRKLQVGDLAECDAFAELVEAIATHFRFARLPTFAAAVWTGGEVRAYVDSEHFETLRQFTGLIIFTFRVFS